MRIRSALALTFVLASLAHAEDKAAPEKPAAPANPAPEKIAPPGGRSLLGDNWSDGGKLAGENTLGTMRRIVVTGQPFDSAIEVTTTGTPPTTYALQVVLNPTGPVAKGDTLYATFWARSERALAGAAFVDFVFEKATEDFKKSVIFPSSVRSEWTQVQVPFQSAGDYAAGDAHIAFRCGFAGQVVQIADFKLVDYGQGVAVNSLPHTEVTYPGREADAPWRAAANQRIDQIRKADLTLHVTGPDGKPRANAPVTVAQTRHAFGFGNCVVASAVASNDAAEQTYKDTIAKLYNEVVFENDLKWGSVDRGSEKVVFPALDWLDAHHIRTRGHNLVWPSWRFLPESIKALKDDKEKLKAAVEQHVTSTAEKYKGRVIDWDVLNEPFNNHDLMDILGKDVMVDWFKLARAADPSAKLYLNDWGITEGGGNAKAHQDSDFDTLKFLKDSGAPIDGFGLQSHFDNSLTALPRVYEILDRYASLGLRLKITELDVSVPDPQTQADYLRDYMTICFSHPNVDGILMWGFWEKRHWLPKAALFNADWSPRPAEKAYEDLVFKTWWTNETVTTDANGDAHVRGFLGDYEITTGAVKQTVTLEKAGAKVDLTAK